MRVEAKFMCDMEPGQEFYLYYQDAASDYKVEDNVKSYSLTKMGGHGFTVLVDSTGKECNDKLRSDRIVYIPLVEEKKTAEDPTGKFLVSMRNHYNYADDLHLPVLNHEEEIRGMTFGKIACIKLYRARTGTSLPEAKNAIEQWFEKHNLKFDSSY